MKNGIVSIIIPCFNYAHYLPQCLDSVFRQRYRNTEIIVVDDGSVDNTREVVRNYQDRIHYVAKKNEGLSAARNTGLEHVTGDYIQFLDADDLLHPHAIVNRVDFLDRNPSIDIAVCKSRMFDKYKKLSFFPPHWYLPKTKLKIHLAYFNIAPPHAFLSRRQACAEIGLFDTELQACEDYDYWLRGVGCGLKIGRSSGLVYYRKHAFSMSANLKNQWKYDFVLHNRIFQLLSDFNNREPVSETLAIYMAFITGACVTLQRVCDYLDRGQLELLEDKVLSAMQTALELVDRVEVLSDEALYYLSLSRPSLHENRLSDLIRENLSELYVHSERLCLLKSEKVETLFRCLSPRSNYEKYLRLKIIKNYVS